MARFEIHSIADSACTKIHDEVIAQSDDRFEAETLATKHSNTLYGAAVLDTETGEIDFGHDLTQDEL